MEHTFRSDVDVTRLPPEIWHLIAEELLKIGPNDLENLLNSSEFFQDVLASLRTTYLFEKVFPLVASSVWKKEGLEGLPVSDVLQLRGVCKHWNAVIDKLIPEKLQHFDEGSSDEDGEVASIGDAFRPLVEFTRLSDNYTDVNETIHNFLRQFERSHPGYHPNGRNPFIWGDVYVGTIHDKDRDLKGHHQFLEGVTTMLSKYGSHIYQFTLNCQGDEFTDHKNVPMFQKWFSCLPNLKELHLDTDIYNWYVNENTVTIGWEFPKYKRLEKLRTEHLPETVFNPLIRENNHISTLHIEYILDSYDFFTFPLPNLRHLTIKWISELDCEKISTSPYVQWSLESLTVDLADETDGFDMLFQMIQDKFSSSLVSLEIGKEDKENDEGHHWLDCMNWRLQLPKLRKITWIMNQNNVCLDFLLGMKHSLEEISVYAFYRETQPGALTSRTIVQFMGFEGKMLESNIWMLFKNLKKLVVQAEREGEQSVLREYSREEWMLNNKCL